MLKNGLFAGSLRQLLRSLLVWCASAVLLLLLSSLILSRTGTSSSILGYLCSAISFLSATAAGYAGGRKKGAFLFQAILTAVFLILFLLTIGSFLNGEYNSSGVLSVVSFTFSGVILGALLASGKRSAGSRRTRRRSSALRRKPAV